MCESIGYSESDSRAEGWPLGKEWYAGCSVREGGYPALRFVFFLMRMGAPDSPPCRIWA